MSKRDGIMQTHDMKGLRKLVENKGANEALRDTGARAILTEFEKRDMQRMGFLKALADMCAFAATQGIPKDVVIECLKGAIEGLDHV